VWVAGASNISAKAQVLPSSTDSGVGVPFDGPMFLLSPPGSKVGVPYGNPTASISPPGSNVGVPFDGPTAMPPGYYQQPQGGIQLYLQAIAALNACKYQAAERLARQSLAAYPDFPVPKECLAAALAGEGKTAEAMQVYALLKSNNDPNPDVMLPYCLLLLKSGDFNDALDVYTKCMPNVSRPVVHGNVLLEQESDFLPGTQDFVHLEADVRLALGFMYVGPSGFQHPSCDSALNEYSKAYSLEPKSSLVGIAYADGLSRVGRNTEARAVLQNVIENSTGDANEVAKTQMATTPLVDAPKRQLVPATASH
jgi:tetratricopeptide (TPR) repeat protein